jgi:hypothetical protein
VSSEESAEMKEGDDRREDLEIVGRGEGSSIPRSD